MNNQKIDLNVLNHTIDSMSHKSHTMCVRDNEVVANVDMDGWGIRIYVEEDNVSVFWQKSGQLAKNINYPYKNKNEFLEICQKLLKIVQ